MLGQEVAALVRYLRHAQKAGTQSQLYQKSQSALWSCSFQQSKQFPDFRPSVFEQYRTAVSLPRSKRSDAVPKPLEAFSFDSNPPSPDQFNGYVDPMTGLSPPEADGETEKASGKVRGPKQQMGIAPQPRRLVTTPISPNYIAEPFRGTMPSIPWEAYLSKRGWREKWRRMMGGVKSLYTLAKCKRNIPHFDFYEFKAEAVKLYAQINASIAAGDRTGLRHVLTPRELTNVKRQLKLREEGGWSRVDWSLASKLNPYDAELIQARIMALDSKNTDLFYAQLTVRYRAQHKFAAFDRSGTLKAGDPQKTIPVQDIWVFERTFMKGPHSRWRLAGKIMGLPPEPPSRKSWVARLSEWAFSSGRQRIAS